MFANLDKKKKIIIGVVFVAALGILTLIMSLILFPKMKESDDKLIVTPNVDEKQLEEKSKLEIYNQDERDLKKYFSKDGKYGIDTEFPEDEKLLQGQFQNFDGKTEENDYTKRQERYMKALSNIASPGRSYSSGSGYSSGYGSDYGSGSESSLSKIFELQDKIRAGLTQGAASRNAAGLEDTLEIRENKKDLVKNEVRDQKNFFQGTTGGNNNKILQLIPSETIEQKRILDKNIIPIRIKEDMRLSDVPGGLVIPKNTIVYGRISLKEDRISIDIESYKKDNVLYLLNFRVYDYDGREGIHMNNHSWLKIPSTVSQDVFDYAIKRGTNAGSSVLGGGANTGIDLKEARNLAILSAGKEISKEVFEKKRVFLPKKYQLWINIRSVNNGSGFN
ncbi:conjugative transposon protein TraM [Chryseobacterium sp. WLY505]|uniref:conjugative transposon protein TraM n=1 Tax=Chryseobacterium sp. WLY505 TaxID=3068892 RepID=UPI002796AA93|nr:conjugative transposon protein TraM [Chryseobacterium sp. WLY505]MDQ1856014.1 conjugative transposon protein TraM [Chryseobacterium sp. WLY505]